MKKIIKLLLILSISIVSIPAFADIDLNELGSFSDRSTIMNTLNGKTRYNQEQIEKLKEKKLAPTPACLNTQIKKKKLDNVKLLLEAKTNPNESYYMDYPIYTAAKENNFEMVKLLYSYGAKLDRGFYSELFEAVKNKNTEMAEFLISKGAKVNYTDSVTQNSIVYYAFKNNMIDIAKMLIEKGARADRKTLALIKKKKLEHIFENNE